MLKYIQMWFAIEPLLERLWKSIEIRNEKKIFRPNSVERILSVVIDRKPWIVSRLFPRMLVSLFIGVSSDFYFF